MCLIKKSSPFLPQVGLEKMATEHTRLIYMTTGVLLQKVVSVKCLTEYSHIFIDEVKWISISAPHWLCEKHIQIL